MYRFSRQNWLHFGYVSALFCLLCFMYAGNFAWLWTRWMDNPDYSHGPLIPLISLFVIFQKKDEIKRINTQGSSVGLYLIMLAFTIYIISFRAQVNFISSYSLILCMLGIVLFLYGREMFFILAFPIGFLFFMVPFWSGAIIKLSNILKLLSSMLTFSIISIMGYPILRDGVTLQLSNGALEVADPCSGIRSLISLLALGTVFAYYSDLHPFKKILIVLSTIPLAFIANTFRVVFFALVLQKKGVVITEGPMHTLTGLGVFVFALITLLGLSKCLKRV